MLIETQGTGEMTGITAGTVRKLRERTGAGVMDCKKALGESRGDMEAAVDRLRARGLAAAGSRAGKIAAEGLVAAAVDGNRGAIVEVNSETDFVARNERFQEFVRTVTGLALAGSDTVERLLEAQLPEGGTVGEKLTDNIAVLRENLSLRRSAVLQVADGVVVSYVHNEVAPGLGRIGVLVALESDGEKEALTALGRQIAIHIAAAGPLALRGEDLDPALIERERAIASERAAGSGKPTGIAARMVDGALTRFRNENALMSQLFVMDNTSRVEDVIAAEAKRTGSAISLNAYVRFQLGEGIEKKDSGFADEVAVASGVR